MARPSKWAEAYRMRVGHSRPVRPVATPAAHPSDAELERLTAPAAPAVSASKPEPKRK